MQFDKNGDNIIDPSEARILFPALTPQDLSAFFISADTNQDGLISY